MDINECDLRLEKLILSDHKKNKQESWFNLLNTVLNIKKVYKTINHILVRSVDNFVHESPFF